jgi:NAD(P)-dependent dehydrogenase (short-subunit alcohol dehydrogenase family)
MELRLDGRTAIVTGGARGIGAATTRVLAAAGEAVLTTDVLDSEGEALAAEHRDQGLRVRFTHLDVTDESAWQRCVAEAGAGFGGSVAYHAAKGAVRLMTKNAALRYATEGIRVNSVHPGFIDTPMITGIKGTDLEAAILAATPMGRLSRSEEIAAAILFLASDAASYVTGSELYADGGWTAR